MPQTLEELLAYTQEHGPFRVLERTPDTIVLEIEDVQIPLSNRQARTFLSGAQLALSRCLVEYAPQ